jgi:hypothetical protein
MIYGLFLICGQTKEDVSYLHIHTYALCYYIIFCVILLLISVR